MIPHNGHPFPCHRRFLSTSILHFFSIFITVNLTQICWQATDEPPKAWSSQLHCLPTFFTHAVPILSSSSSFLATPIHPLASTAVKLPHPADEWPVGDLCGRRLSGGRKSPFPIFQTIIIILVSFTLSVYFLCRYYFAHGCCEAFAIPTLSYFCPLPFHFCLHFSLHCCSFYCCY